MQNAIKDNVTNQVSNLGEGPKVKKGKRISLGSCNFCTKRTDEVYEFVGRSILIRACEDCYNAIIAAKEELK